jgi:hypothetical protein
MEGEPRLMTPAILIPAVGALTLLRHGTDAEIKAGMAVTAYVDADAEIALAK